MQLGGLLAAFLLLSGRGLPILPCVRPPMPPTRVFRFLTELLKPLFSHTLCASVTLVLPASLPAPAPLQAQRPTQPLRHPIMGLSLAETPWLPHLSSHCVPALPALPKQQQGADCLLFPGLGLLAVCRACHSVPDHVSKQGCERQKVTGGSGTPAPGGGIN